MQLADVAHSRDNNFNLIRILAAYAVLVTHSFPLTGLPEPFGESLGMTMGSVAVDIFFIASGFLVTASLLKRQSLLDFIWARSLRIFPALLVVILLTVLALGPAFTTLALPDYFAHPLTRKYLTRCLTLFGGVAYDLPGVFENLPYPKAVNGSLWTMPHEVKMYAALALLWAILEKLKLGKLNVNKMKTLRVLLPAVAILAGAAVLASPFLPGKNSQSTKLIFMFFTGASLYLHRDRIVLSYRIFFGLGASLALAAFHPTVFHMVYMSTVALLLFHAAYLPAGVLRQYNRLGDYSYGIYIYAFPVQQMVAACVPGVSVWQMMLLSTCATLALAVASWHLLEKRMLTYKDGAVLSTRRLFLRSETEMA